MPAADAAPRPEARRVPGPNVFAPRPGAVIEVTFPAGTPAHVVGRHWRLWGRVVVRLVRRLGWPAVGPRIAVRTSAGAAGSSRAGTCYLGLFVAAPADQLDAAVAVAEHAWAVAASRGRVPDDPGPELEALAAAERDPRVVSLLDAADARGLVATVDDEGVSVGAGRGGRTWPRASLPELAAVPWDALGNVPVGLVTGSNGKTTVARMAAAILRAAGHTTGLSTTDGVRVDAPDPRAAPHELLEEGDWAGPGGARRVVRDPRVTAAVLETARGGILRRGLAVRRAAAAVVTNVAADHLGEHGVEDLDGVAAVKLVVADALRDARATLIAPAAPGPLLSRVESLSCEAPFRCWWTNADPTDATARAHVDAATARGTPACVVRAAPAGRGAADEVLAWFDGAMWHDLARVGDLPFAAGGAARHNLANAASAAALAFALGASVPAVREGLAGFGAGARDNPGRLERFEVGGVTAVVDYAHNPDGLAALHAATRGLPAARRLLLLGQAGDRDDAALAALAAAGWGGGAVDRVVVKELPSMRRGRAPGEVAERLRGALAAAGAPDAAIADAPSEVEAVRVALAWARPGDLLLFPLHEAREEVVRWLAELAAAGWRAGAPLPVGPRSLPAA